MVGLRGLEPLTSSLSVTRSNQLSYSPEELKVLVETRGFEPRTPCLQSRCSSQLSYVPNVPQIRPINPTTAVLYLV